MLERFYSTPALKGFHWPGRLLCGPGASGELARLVDPATALVVADAAVAARARDLLPAAPCLGVSGEPDEAGVARLRAAAGGARPQTLVALGGGSAIDCAKALALALRHGDAPLQDRPRGTASPRLVVLPTLAGAGAETSRFFIVKDAAGCKRATRSWDAVPDLTLIDPLLLGSAGRARLVAGAFDAFVHLWETFVCRNERNPWTDMLALTHIPPLCAAVARITAGEDLTPGTLGDLALASAMGGIAISTVRTGLVHTAAEALSAATPLPHPLTLSVFFETVAGHYAPAIGARLALLSAALGRPAWPHLGQFWRDALARTGGLNAVQEVLRAAPPDPQALCAAVARDTVLVKEHPADLTPEIVRGLIETALAQGLSRHDSAPALSAH